jgi:multiple antibiotic resistance protein
MSPAEFAVNFFVALFALIDPIGNVPLFAAATAGASAPGRRLTAAYIAGFSFVFLSFFFLTGLGLLQFFGISLPAFRIAGGILLLLLGLDMARGDLANSLADPDEETKALSTRAYAAKRFEGLVVPFAIPLLIGPGAISTAVIYAGEAKAMGFAGWAAGIGVIGVVCVLVLASFWMTGRLSRLLGKIGMVIVVRVLGLILCAMAVQFLLAGLADATHGVFRRDAATPYQHASGPPEAAHLP